MSALESILGMFPDRVSSGKQEQILSGIGIQPFLTQVYHG